jgi:hypothetical protein
MAGAIRDGASYRKRKTKAFATRRFAMFEGKNNRMLDSFYFRFIVTAGLFLAWFGASYLVLALS